MKRSVGIVVLLLLILPAIASAQTIVRDIPDCVTLGEEFQVRFSVSDAEVAGGFVEQIPNGFAVTDTGSSDPDSIEVEYDPTNNTVTVGWAFAGSNFEVWYNVTAPSTAGSYTFSAVNSVMLDTSGNEIQVPIQDSVLQVADTCAPPVTTTPTPTTPTPTTPTPTLNDGPIQVPELNIDMVKLSDDEISVGEELEIDAVWNKLEDSTRRIVVIKWTDYQEVDGNIGKLLDNAETYWTLSEDAGDATYTFSPEEPGYYYVVVYGSAPNVATTINDDLVFRAKAAVAGKPSVSINVDKSKVAIGDYVKVEASMSTDVPVSVVKVFVTGSGYFLNETGYGGTSYMLCYAVGGEWYNVEDACGKDEWWVKISNVPEGTYVAKIDVGEGPTRAEATEVFSIVKPAIESLDVPSTHVKGTDLVIEGTTNLAKSGEESDNATIAPEVENWAYLTIEDLSGNVIVSPAVTNAAKSYIDEGGKFRFKIDNFGTTGVGGALDTGYYKVTISITSGILTDDETAVMEIVKPEISRTADKTTATRGDTVEFTIDTNLKVNNPV
ncbi:MAG TPA: hypothetical protein ENG14_01130, partial [Thermodesulforhabdus norvegica]|nr:hypothetical protein [Thermodesulforhabdus norvegica]